MPLHIFVLPQKLGTFFDPSHFLQELFEKGGSRDYSLKLHYNHYGIKYDENTVKVEVGVIQRRRAAVLSLRYVMASNVPFEKNKMASTLAVSMITIWCVPKMQGG